ncbi:MAG: hypothetical protein AVDCRST_MAG57-368, partial [uncultured Blastococcus sp.]
GGPLPAGGEHRVRLRALRGAGAGQHRRPLPQPLPALPVVAACRRPAGRPGQRVPLGDGADRAGGEVGQGLAGGPPLHGVRPPPAQPAGARGRHTGRPRPGALAPLAL